MTPKEAKKSEAPPPIVDPSPKEAVPWFVGAWSFDGKVKSLSPALALDEADRARASGKEPAPSAPTSEESLVLQLRIEKSGQVQGTARLGQAESPAFGSFEGETLRARFVSESWTGHLVANKSGADLVGEVRAARLMGESSTPVVQAFLGAVTLVQAPAPKP